MRTFDHPNMENFICPICKTNKDLPIVLIPIQGTEIVEANQYHLDCIELVECTMPDKEKFLIQVYK